VACWSTKTAISLKRDKIEEKLLWRAYGGPIGSRQRSFDFWGRRHISISGFASTATETAVFALFLPVQPSNRYWMVQMDFLAANHVCIVGLCGHAHRAVIFAIAQLSCFSVRRRLPAASVQWPATPTAVNNTAAAAATALAYGGHQPTILAAYPTQQGTPSSSSSSDF